MPLGKEFAQIGNGGGKDGFGHGMAFQALG
jgi:hypothetical protein